MSVSTIALAWTIARADGVTIRLTDHDRDLEVAGATYRAAPGMTPTGVRRSDGLEPDTMDVAGALTSDGIGEADLLAGRWDGARVRLAAVDWMAGTVVADLGSGTIGTVETRDDAFTAELRGVGAALDRLVAEETTPACRAELGDRRCRVAMAARRRFARVLAADGATVTLDVAEPVANGWGGGLVRWFEGANTGLTSAVAASASAGAGVGAGASLTLRAPPVFPVAPGTLVEVSEGCDRTIASCAGRFGNAANFRGEPYLPGMDLLTRYPGG